MRHNSWNALELGFIVVLLALIAAVKLHESLRYWRNSKNPVTSVKAVVIDRERICYHNRYRTQYEYKVRFRPVDGGPSEEFTVGEEEYDAYRLGDRGVLSRRTWEFISFRPERRADNGSIPVGFAEDEK